jgi:RNA polymerase sigma-70 factor (ECF subfamily)
MEVLAPGVTLVADGGGRTRAPLHPIYGADRVARFLLSVSAEEKVAKFLEVISAEALPELLRAHIAQVNGEPGIVLTYEGTPVTTIVLDVLGGVVQTIHLVANPEKLLGVRAIETL